MSHRYYRHLCALLTCCLCWQVGSAFGQQNDRPTFTKLTVGSYNVENMFDVFDDPYTDDEGTDVKQRDEIEIIARAIKAVDADVMAFTEIENEGVLRGMVHEMLPDAGYDYVIVSPTNSNRGINLGLISRVPVKSVTSYRWQWITSPTAPERRWRFARDLLHVQIEPQPGKVMHLFIVHFKSRRSTDDDPNSNHWRMAEARAAHRVIREVLEADPDAWVVMMGDFNDTPDTPVMQLLAGTADPTEPGLLRDQHRQLDAATRLTYLREPYRSIIDFVLASPSLDARRVEGSAQVLNDDALLAGSDHAPITVTFDLDE